MDNEKDIFDLIREGSENLTEQPPAEAWKRLEKRLTTVRKHKRPLRRPLQMQLTAVTVAVVLLLSLAAISWFITRQHEEILRGRREFAQLHFLKGQWLFSDKKAKDIMTWNFKDSLTLAGEKSLYFTNTLLSTTSVIIKNQGATNVLILNHKTQYELKQIVNNTFIFRAKNKEEVRLRKATDARFTLSFGEGIIFVFKREP